MIQSLPHFMVSYSHEDAAQVAQIEACLNTHSVPYYIDKKDIHIAQYIPDRIRTLITSCTHFLVYISPATSESDWVPGEIGMAFALGRPIICFKNHRSQAVPPWVSLFKHLHTVEELSTYLHNLMASRAQYNSYSMTAVQRASADRLYYHCGAWASAIRLFGAEDQLILPDRLDVRYDPTEFQIEPDLKDSCKRHLVKHEACAKEKGQQFFNGPCTRLRTWRSNPRNDERVALEEPTIELELGPVSWYQFEGLNGAFRHEEGAGQSVPTYEYRVRLGALLRDGDVSKSRLSNILDNAVTIITADGYVGYQRRSGGVSSVPGELTSSVAENINRCLDDTDAHNPRRRLRTLGEIRNLDKRKLDVDYVPRGIPHPLAAVERGIASELSPSLLKFIAGGSALLSGLSFDLGALHPDLLFVVVVDLDAERVTRLCREEPGEEFWEGRLHFIPADGQDRATATVLREPGWVAAGKASVIRALEVLHAIQRQQGCDLLGAIAHVRAVQESTART